MQIEKSLGTVETSLARQEIQRSMVIDMIKNSLQAAECLGERINAVPSMSQDQSENLLEKPVQLQTQVEEFKSSICQTYKIHSSTVVFSDDFRQKDENNYPHEEFSESINRICSLAIKPERTVFSYEAQCIISDIEKISKILEPTETNATRKRKLGQKPK